jgi:hypothetical protein
MLFLALVLAAACGSAAFESEKFQFRDDFGVEPLYDCYLQYYYYAPCPTYAWFWAFTGLDAGEMVGAWFEVGDFSLGTGLACDPTDYHVLEGFRVLDFAGYGTIHGCFACVEFDIYCCDEQGCPVGPSLWNSGTVGLSFGWNYFLFDNPLDICECSVNPGPPPSAPRILVTATHIGYNYPAWGFDDISTGLEVGCELHDISSYPVLYPRPYNSYYTSIHSGFYGQNFAYCPPLLFLDGRDTTPDGSEYGYIELAWRVYLMASGPSSVEPTTWGNVKRMYR